MEKDVKRDVVKCCLNCKLAFHPDHELFGYCDHAEGGVITPLTKTCRHFTEDDFGFIESVEQLTNIQELWKRKDPSLGITFDATFNPLKEIEINDDMGDYS